MNASNDTCREPRCCVASPPPLPGHWSLVTEGSCLQTRPQEIALSILMRLPTLPKRTTHTPPSLSAWVGVPSPLCIPRADRLRTLDVYIIVCCNYTRLHTPSVNSPVRSQGFKVMQWYNKIVSSISPCLYILSITP